MRWQTAKDKEGNKDNNAIVRGRQTISKCYVDGCTLYVLWHGDERIGHFDGPEDAKSHADFLVKQEMVGQP